MRYKLKTTNIYDKWFKKIKNNQYKARILARLNRIRQGNFGDFKQLEDDLFELRLFFGPGFRIYYTVQEDTVVLMLCGGDKSSQQKDIEKAKIIMEVL